MRCVNEKSHFDYNKNDDIIKYGFKKINDNDNYKLLLNTYIYYIKTYKLQNQLYKTIFVVDDINIFFVFYSNKRCKLKCNNHINIIYKPLKNNIGIVYQIYDCDIKLCLSQL